MTASLVGTVVRRCVAYHRADMEPGTHLGLPSHSLTMVLSVGPPTQVVAMPDPDQAPRSFMALIGGLHMRPAVIAYGAVMSGIQLDLTPQAARRFLGFPASQLAHSVVDMHDVLGSAAEELLDRLHAADSSAARRAAVFDVLSRTDVAIQPACGQVDRAWEMIVGSDGAMSLDGVAGALGWSRRHLDRAFTAEFGLTPKDVARVARFTHSREMLQQHPSVSLAALGSACGYFDQAHMAREWNQLAGRPASAWWADEGVRFFQAQGEQTSAS